MSNQTLANSATELSASTPKDINFAVVVEKNAKRTVKGVTRERLLLNNSKLFALCCEEVRSLLCIEKGTRLPDEVANNVQSAVNDYITGQINRVHPQNCISFRRYFAHDFRNMRIVDRINVLGENVLALKEQHLGCDILIREKEKRLDDLMAKATPDYDKEAAAKEEIAKLKLTRTHIEACLASLESNKKSE